MPVHLIRSTLSTIVKCCLVWSRVESLTCFRRRVRVLVSLSEVGVAAASCPVSVCVCVCVLAFRLSPDRCDRFSFV